MRIFRVFALTLLAAVVAPAAHAQPCGGPGQAPCAVLDVLPLCYNVYRDETLVEYYPCQVQGNFCSGSLVLVKGRCQSRLAADRGIRCCNDVVRADGAVVGKKAVVDLTIAATVVPPTNVDYCDWNVAGRPNAVRTMDRWMADYRSLIAVNANFFDAQVTYPNPHLRACTRAYGPTVRDGSYIAGQSETSINGIAAWTFVKFTTDHAISLGYPADVIATTDLPTPRYLPYVVDDAVTGVLLARAGEYNVELDGSPFKPNDRVPRVAIGLSVDKKSLTIVVVQNGNQADGMTLRELAKYMIESTNSAVALNLDGGGSATLYFNDGTGAPPFMTPPSDRLPGLSSITGSRYYRPFPVFLGFQ